MSKVFCVVRATNEDSFNDCIGALENLKYPYVVIKSDSSLEDKSKSTIKIGAEKSGEYGWIMAVDADVIITQQVDWVEKYCEHMEKNTDWFCFTGWLDCTKRGLIVGLHFFRTSECQKAYDIIKDRDFSFHMGRQEYEICKLLKLTYGMNWDTGYLKESFGKHLFEVNNHGKT